MLPPVEVSPSSLMSLQAGHVICLGNELASDDGVGMRVGRALERMQLPSQVTLRYYPQIDLDLIDDFLTARRVIVCDATWTGQQPGSVTVRDARGAAELSRSVPYCCHGIGLTDLIAIASEVDQRVLSKRIHVVGVEAMVLDRFGTELSAPVMEALPLALQEVLRLLGATEGLLNSARAMAKVLADLQPIEAIAPGASALLRGLTA